MIDKDDASWIPKQADEGADISSELEGLRGEVVKCTEAIQSMTGPNRE